MTNPFLVVITFISGQVMYIEQRTRTGMKNVAAYYRSMDTVQRVRMYQETEVDRY